MPVEFSRRLPWGAVADEPRLETLIATPAETAALAERFGILGVDSLVARLTIRAGSDGAAEVQGTLSARVTQTCVVTLAPLEQLVSEPLALRFLPEGMEPSDDPDGPDEIPTEGDVIELGEAVAESLALALDPFPRHPEAAIPPEYAAPPEEEEPPAPVPPKPNPFAALAALKKH